MRFYGLTEEQLRTVAAALEQARCHADAVGLEYSVPTVDETIEDAVAIVEPLLGEKLERFAMPSDYEAYEASKHQK